ncbi:hypothetical protein AERO8C_20232 [Aeromonas veronii]|uniref:Uncharacterized protein n=1 Tax=Aeromonas veronii TaxID=654 RepID=A0A653L2D4_AERVE|nr:hypothetical protein AERO8C_20232 [Aeromonas veronii]
MRYPNQFKTLNLFRVYVFIFISMRRLFFEYGLNCF